MREKTNYKNIRIGAIVAKEPCYVHNILHWNCVCDCGNIIKRRPDCLSFAIKKKRFSTCGCLVRKENGKKRTIVGMTIEDIKILKYDCEKNTYTCQNEENKIFELTSHQLTQKIYREIKNKNKKELEKEKLKKFSIKNKKEYTKKSIRLHHIFFMMRQRCYDRNHDKYEYYGKNGVKICQEWLENPNSFVEWSLLNGYNDDLTIDRIDTYGNYEPSNCRWVDKITQANNKKNTFYIEYQGKRQSLKQWCRELDLNYKKTFSRIKYSKWTIEKAFTTK